MLVYDITDAKSFESLDSWRDEFLNQVGADGKDFPFVVLGNKSDLAKTQRKKRHPFYETSAKDKINVEQAFITVAKSALKKEPVRPPPYAPKDALDLKKKQEVKKSNDCC
ncbi:hypothetical protein RFI_23335 [Reticulomyxa filosa]|uniref:Uncharacterized protein n=1 Tax=Reticulomyxa filosa TaxID=46433 RepID=X6MKQ4_RETFI|nr:hypothetical protein RFI_23335 [Reticulomyxa filosa]|eukprot:ETO14032.1 hypothetical protein RFI_23335 [Reticulomyxa filosa]